MFMSIVKVYFVIFNFVCIFENGSFILVVSYGVLRCFVYVLLFFFFVVFNYGLIWI